ncbi:hypothetical protein Rsub_11818 [Raphidocelis subcapitata]|uniref:NECAP PHear domain-containing protein n=1 Tax=Raphidocelis subcapitata TaxID=307507 RepID=A0A2V0PGP5_9CHLO|nr:hypothetical protein Rsub_11818 [Raphidocelis subcapitata]|eukprot:GBF99014.1 hypothetical protein Rsub_11818 [Raphidocelis subcapitata]
MAADADDAAAPAELATFSSREAYVYAPLPPAPHYGHRAELWDVNKWLREVKVRVVMRGDDCFVRLEDGDSGELFAECPLPSDGTSLTVAVEPVVDSQRYFVAKVVDREDPKKHAFVGLGFRDRADASDFTAALDDYRQLVRRSKEAEAMRARFEALAAAAGEGGDGGGDGGGGGGAGAEDLRLRETITLKLGGSIKRPDGGREPLRRLSGTVPAGVGGPAAAGAAAAPAAAAAVVAGPSGGLRLAPPPPPPPAGARPVSGGGGAAAAAAAAADGTSAAAGAAAAAAADDDDWAEFQS